MACVRRVLAGVFSLLLTLALAAPAAGQGPSGSAADFEGKALEAMNSTVLTQALNVIGQLETWRKQFDEMQAVGARVVALVKDRPGSDATPDQVAAWTKRVDDMVGASDKLRQLVGTRLADRVRGAGDTPNPQDLLRIYEEEAKRAAQGYALEWISKVEAYLQKQSAEFRTLIDYANKIQARAMAARDQGLAALEAAKAYRDQAFQMLEAL